MLLILGNLFLVLNMITVIFKGSYIFMLLFSLGSFISFILYYWYKKDYINLFIIIGCILLLMVSLI